MKRIAVVGPPGSGKSTVARALGAKLGVPVVHLDLLYWKDGWVETPADEFVLKVSDALAGDEWVSDGNYGSTLDLRLRRADTAVLLEPPTILSLWRSARRRGTPRPDLPAGCVERRFDLEALRFLMWGAWTYRRERHPKLLAAIERYPHLNLIRLRTRAQVTEFLTS